MKSASETFKLCVPHTTVIHADGTDHDVIRGNNALQTTMRFVSMTGIDEENLILSAYAKQQGVQKIITKMSRPALLKVFKGFDNQSVVTQNISWRMKLFNLFVHVQIHKDQC